MTEHDVYAEVRLPGIEYLFPAPADFNGVDAMTFDGADICVLSRAHWFDKRVVTSTKVGDELEVYKDEAAYGGGSRRRSSLAAVLRGVRG